MSSSALPAEAPGGGCTEGSRSQVIPLEGAAPCRVSPSLSHISLIIFTYCLKGKWLSKAIFSFTRLLS